MATIRAAVIDTTIWPTARSMLALVHGCASSKPTVTDSPSTKAVLEINTAVTDAAPRITAVSQTGTFTALAAPNPGEPNPPAVATKPDYPSTTTATNAGMASIQSKSIQSDAEPCPPSAHEPARIAAFFDLDKTILAGSSTLAFSGPLRERGMIDRRALLRSGYAQLLLMLNGADAEFMERMRERISALCAGWEVAEVRAVIDQALHEILRPMIYKEAAALIDKHHRAGHHVVVVSASGEEMVRPIASALGADHCVATRMTIVDGRYTGKIDFYCYGEGKAVAARTLARQHGYRLEDCYAYSDSITDLPLLEAVGHPHAVNPDRALRRIARARGWPVLNFAAPVPLRSRMRNRLRSLLPAPTTSTAVVLGIVAAVVVLTARGRGQIERIKRPS